MELKKGILIALGELFLKSKPVREVFERRLINNLDFYLRKEKIKFKIYFLRDRIFVETDNLIKAKKAIKNVFGVYFLSECFLIHGNDLESFVKENYNKWIKENKTFALKVRAEEGLKIDKMQVIDKVAKLIKRKVNLSKPNTTIYIEAKRAGWLVYTKKVKGEAGLPIGTSGKVLSLISGGIDSPVSSYLIAKRGAENVWLHFHSFPLASNSSIVKVEELAKEFIKYQPALKVIFIPFSGAQVEIKSKAPGNYRVILYRRLMLRIAEQIAEKENCLAIATGESLGQVSSQTLKNIDLISSVIKMPILRPLITNDKEEIITIAKKINSFDISIRPQEDCCTMFVPKHQTASGDILKIKEYEKEIDIKKLIRECLKNIEVKHF